ncbi:MAG: hypothetical protein J6T43_09395 [Prevotella sp.]|nr:hypothetical protein [Prevotella sp.]
MSTIYRFVIGRKGIKKPVPAQEIYYIVLHNASFDDSHDALRISLFEIGKTPLRFRNYPFEKLQILPTFADVKEIQSQCLTLKYRRYDYEENDVPGNDDGDDHHGQRNEL